MQENTRRVRRHSEEFKRQVLHDSAQPRAVVATVARLHGVNVNLVHKWRRQAIPLNHPRDKPAASPPAPAQSFIAVGVAPGQAQPSSQVRIECSRGSAQTLSISVPLSAMAQSVGWLRELLREQLHEQLE